MTRYVLAFTIAMLFSVCVATAQADTAPGDASKATPEESTLAMPVFSLRPLELRNGIDSAKFEAFVKDEFVNAFSKPTHGIRAFVLIGDRGKAKGQYKLLVVFDSKTIRDKYFPVEDGDAAACLQEDATPSQCAVLQKLSSLSDLGEYSDFAAVGK
ncbi:hypothetical protein [Stieleria mannarensis]|uniref:hypothetical protein n=1 Tax=Stieleria mannarensis TaxID=2755585 RepID=UPI001601B88A|nr:hypothetical protein [Rhodopirellula sp. JC639]